MSDPVDTAQKPANAAEALAAALARKKAAQADYANGPGGRRQAERAAAARAASKSKPKLRK
ncbi:hypothetical protein [Caulobacter sp. 17J80-11]|uniref:hypothetical protein n=1 Tax=Caulobacter sp. 17J80-11 TaxID=2763502 RepID=UPI001653DC84|nr:hypothetical protein [Caulobacter sp. 17J80-11]MBC6981894.1 hypothetical protein [Caulobacter sp. 17J80-11]